MLLLGRESAECKHYGTYTYSTLSVRRFLAEQDKQPGILHTRPSGATAATRLDGGGDL